MEIKKVYMAFYIFDIVLMIPSEKDHKEASITDFGTLRRSLDITNGPGPLNARSHLNCALAFLLHILFLQPAYPE